MSTLYVVERGARIEKEYHRLLVTKHGEVIFRVPLRRVTQVVLVGRVGMTTPAMLALLSAEVPVLLVRRSGKLVGRLLPATARNLPLRQAQYRRNDDADFVLETTRAIVGGKLRNQRVMALRLLRRRPDADRSRLETLYEMERKVESAPDVDTLRGIEGAGARAYFGIYRGAFDPDWAFVRRTRRPPRDPINALLSLGYTMLGHSLMAALEVVGLDPYLGFFHAEKYGRPALALDLVEEFRAPFVDSLVMRLINWAMLGSKDFEGDWGEADEEDSAVYLSDRGLRIFFREFGDRLDSRVKPEGMSRSISYRKHFEVQARKMAKVVLGEAENYEPFRIR